MTPASVFAAEAALQMPAVEQKDEIEMDSVERNVLGEPSLFAGAVRREEGLKLDVTKQASQPANEQPREKVLSSCTQLHNCRSLLVM